MTDDAIPTRPTPDDLDDIQGFVYWPWKYHPFAGYLFAQLGDDPARARAWLDELRRDVTPARGGDDRKDRLAVALSPRGLARLGVPDRALAALPQEAKDGMASRARILGDAPRAWELGGPSDPLDVLVMVYAETAAARDALLDARRRALIDAGARVRAPELSHPLDEREHFGFKDGVTQPHLPGVFDAPLHGQDEIATGEILLGYRNAYGHRPHSPRWDGFDLGRNGSYLVFRKLHQHVATFWSYLLAQARRLAPGPGAGADPDAAAIALATKLAAKLMGRWPNGASLVRAPDEEDDAAAAPELANAFSYLEEDPHGLCCPITSHVRRANPRDARGGSAEESLRVSNRHRIVRRGRAYGPPLARPDALAGRDDGVPRGLYFMSLQASIARGFEFIQQTWLSNPGFGGLYDEADPIMGNDMNDGPRWATIPCEPVRVRLPDVPLFVTVAGGGYFFLPSLGALARIARG